MLVPSEPNRKALPMNISIHIDTDAGLTATDKAVLRALVGDATPSASTHVSPQVVDIPEPIKAAPVKAAPVKAAPAKKQAPEPEVAPSATEDTAPEPEVTPEPEAAPEAAPEAPAAKAKPNTTSTDLPVMELLVKRAAELISGGERARVKVALEAVGAGRVSEVTPDQAEAFLAALGE